LLLSMKDAILSMEFLTDLCSRFVEFLVLLFFVDLFDFILFVVGGG
jgi:hypothetical protein